MSASPTLSAFAEQWTSGALAARYPSRVRVRQAAELDAGVLKKHVLSVIGDRPVSQVTLDDAERVADSLPLTLAASHRRRILELLLRLLDLAVYPARLLAANPIPRRGFMPLPERSTFTYLRPAEDAALMECTDLGLTQRIFWGLLAREGFRWSEAMDLTWADLDLEHGIVTLGKHKTVRHTGSRSWPLDGGSWRTLVWLRGERASEPMNALVFGHLLSEHDASLVLRRGLRRAGVLRRELHERSAGGRPLRAHDLRGSFVTIARAAGKDDAWIMDRTGHTTGGMLAKYARPAREAADRGFGWWTDLDKAIPEVSGRAPIRNLPTLAETVATARASGSAIAGFSTGAPWPHEDDENPSNVRTFRARIQRVSLRRRATSHLLTAGWR